MDINYHGIAEEAVACAAKSGIRLEYSKEGVKGADRILSAYNEKLSDYGGEDGEKALWNAAVYFGVFLGEALLKSGLLEKGFKWVVRDGLPVLRNDERNTECSPITKAHKRIKNGPEDSLTSFFDVSLAIAEGRIPLSGKARRAVDVVLVSGERIKNVPLAAADGYISLVAEGKTDFVILESADSFLQFYGLGDRFVTEARFGLSKDFRYYAMTSGERVSDSRITLKTPFGTFTPMDRRTITRKELDDAVRAYYESVGESDFIGSVSHDDITEEMKKILY